MGQPLGPERVPPRLARIAQNSVSRTAAEGGVSLTPSSRKVIGVDDGAVRCEVVPQSLFRRRGVRFGCPGKPPGFVPIPQTPPGALRTTVTARRVGSKDLLVRFRARVAVTDHSSAYEVTVHPPPATRCVPPHPVDCGGAFGDETGRNIRAGQVVVKRVGNLRLSRRPGRYRVTVTLRQQSPTPGPRGNLQAPGTFVGETVVVVR